MSDLNLVGTDGDDSLAGGTGNDSLDGGLGNDTLTGGAGNDSLTGGDGNDLLVGDETTYSSGSTLPFGGNDTLDGGAGNDTMDGGMGRDTYRFGRGDGQDVIIDLGTYSLSGDPCFDALINTIEMGDGVLPSDVTVTITSMGYRFDINGTADSLSVQTQGNRSRAIEQFYSGAAQFNIVFTDGTVWSNAWNPAPSAGSVNLDSIATPVATTSGNDTIYGASLNDTLLGQDGNDRLYGGGGSDSLSGGNGNDSLYGQYGNDTLDGGIGADSLAGGDGNDTYVVDDTGDVVSETLVTVDAGGTDSVLASVSYTLPNYVENLTLTSSDPINATGNNLANVLSGNDGDNQLYGNNGNDTLTGGAGNDTLAGGAGNDTYVFNHDDGVDTVSDSSGTDTLRFGAGIALDDVDFNMSGSDLVVSLRGTGDQVTLANWSDANQRIENVQLADGTTVSISNWMVGNDANNVLNGLAGNDGLFGGLGDDTLDGGLGDDTMSGGTGDDWYYVDSAGDAVVENANEGDNDIVWSSVSWTLGPNTEHLGLTGNAAINGTGNELNNAIAGNSADNVLTGGAGNDVLGGTSGNDTYVFNRGDGADQIIDEINISSDGKSEEYGDAGSDTLRFGAGIGLDDLDLSASGPDVFVSLRGSNGDRVQFVNWADPNRRIETIAFADGSSIATTDLIQEGGSGDDSLSGNGYNNLVDGGAGNDTLTGGGGRDTLTGGQGDDVYVFNRGDGSERISDYFVSDAKSGTYGDAGNDTLQFGAGIALDDLDFSMSGSDLVVSLRGSSDQITLTNWSDPNRCVENIRFADGTSVIENGDLSGAQLIGTDGNDTLDGGLGDDTLDGGLGDDTLAGGAGDDFYEIDATGDVVTEAADGGFDTAVASVSWTLADNVEELYLTGDATSGTGNALDNWMVGNDADNVLAGLAGNDGLFGGSGNDSFDGGDGDDILDSWDGNDTLTGGAGNDMLDGGPGNDMLTGGTGDDTYYFDAGWGSDTISENDATTGNVDAIEFGAGIALSDIVVTRDNNNLSIARNGSSDTITLQNYYAADGSGRVEQLRFADGTVVNDPESRIAPSSDETLTGGAGDDYLYGGAGNDLLTGDETGKIKYSLGSTLPFNGNDTLDGGAGNDTLDGSMGGDTYRFGRGYGQDLIIDQSYYSNNGDPCPETLTNTIEMGADVLPSDVTVTITSTGYRFDINGTTDSLSVEMPDSQSRSNEYLYTGAGQFNIVFADGTVWSNARIQNRPAGSINLDSIATPVATTSGNDTIYGASLNDTLLGQDGNDRLYGGGGSDSLSGGNGNDSLYGQDGNDTLDGGIGADSLAGGAGNDTYVVDDTSDVVSETLVMVDAGGTDSVLASVSYTLPNYVENLTLTGIDPINATGNNLANVLTGNEGDNQLYGNNGNDTLTGGAGNDMLIGGAGNDTYLFHSGDGSDTISENDSTAGNLDTLDFSTSANSDQLWFQQVGNDLEVDIIGTSDAVTIANWYSGSAYHVEQFMSADGKVLNDTQVDQLVQAMAAFAPPAAGQTTLPQEYSDALAPVLAANWTSA